MSKANRLTRLALPPCFALIALAGCGSILPASNSAQIRIIDAAPDAPMLDLYQGQSALSYNVTFGNITSYISIPIGPADLFANVGGSRQPLAVTHESLVPGQYTLLLGNTASNLQPFLLKDRVTPAPTGQAAVRFIDQVTVPQPFDIYLVSPGTPVATTTPVLTNQFFNTNSSYLNIPAGPYRIVLYPSGTVPSPAVPAAYSGTTITYPSGVVRTVVLLDQRIPLRPSVQIVSATDVDPASRAN